MMARTRFWIAAALALASMSGLTLAVTTFTGDLVINNGYLYMNNGATSSNAPEIHLTGNRGAWIIGMDIMNNGGSRDFVLAAKQDWPLPGQVNDIVYVRHGGSLPSTVGIGVTPPDGANRLQVSGDDSQPSMGGLMIRRGPQQTGKLITVREANGTDSWWLGSDLWLQGLNSTFGGSVGIKADNVYGRPLVMAKPDGTVVYGFQYKGNSLDVGYITGGFTNMTLQTNGKPNFPNGFTQTSDERLKNISGAFTRGARELMQLNPITYTFKENNALGLKNTGPSVGLRAQEVQRVIPEAVSKNDQGYLVLDNQPVLWAMLNAVKEQQVQIQRVVGDNRELRRQVAEQDRALAKLRSELRLVESKLARQ